MTDRVESDVVNGEAEENVGYSVSAIDPEVVTDIRPWLESLVRWGGDVQQVSIPESELVDDGLERFYIYTRENSYSLYVKYPRIGDANDVGYLGCIASSRTPRAGEDWTRGNDLSDGPLTHETWVRIVQDIVAYEMVKVHHKHSKVTVLDFKGR